MKKTSIFDKMNLTLHFLKSKGLDEIEWDDIQTSWGGIQLNVEKSNLTEDQLRLLKRHFGPFEVSDSYSTSKNQKGKKMMEIDFATDKPGWTINLTIDQAYICKKVDPAEVSDMEWENIRQRAIDGGLTITDCTYVDGK